MALNYSSCSLLTNDDCAAMMRGGGGGYWSEEASPMSSCGVNSLWWDEMEEEEHCDPVDLLPTDPFGMNLDTTFTAAIASCISDLAVMSGGENLGSAGGGAVFDELSYYLSQAFAASSRPHPGLGDVSMGHRAPLVFGGYVGGCQGAGSSLGFSTHELPLQSVGFVEEPSSSGNDAVVCLDADADVPVQEDRVPHEGMLFALGYLGLRDLLSVEMVCKSLCSAVRSDPLLWQCIHIDSQLSEKISDDDLLHLTQKSQGVLQCLSLVGCSKITDQGLKAVLESIPRLTKLSILGCVRLTVEGLIANLKSFNMQALAGIKNLRLGKLFSVAPEHFEELISLLSIDKVQEFNTMPRFYHHDHLLLDCDDKSALDIEMCPTCHKYKLVYDCPSESCKDKICRACDVCIPRCVQCGSCIKNSEYVETFCLEYLCSNCWKYPLASVTEK